MKRKILAHKRAIAGVVAALLALIMILSVAAPFIYGM
jgi:flagellin-like protein